MISTMCSPVGFLIAMRTKQLTVGSLIASPQKLPRTPSTTSNTPNVESSCYVGRCVLVGVRGVSLRGARCGEYRVEIESANLHSLSCRELLPE